MAIGRFGRVRVLWWPRKDRRREVIDLLAAPTHSVLRITRKGDAGHLLSRGEWTAVAHLAQHRGSRRSR